MNHRFWQVYSPMYYVMMTKQGLLIVFLKALSSQKAVRLWFG